MNITDVGHLTDDADEGEDKMELASRKVGRTIWEIAESYTSDFFANLAELHVLSPTVAPRATEYIGEMIEFARACERGGYTYELEGGLYFDTTRVPRYGELGGLDVAAQQEGARVARVEGRRAPSDFVLWRRSPMDKQRLMEWDSPWGVGAPGWHLECSVMSAKLLGLPFDIHTGGVDHRQLHHCNEIAQNQAFCDRDEVGARFWLHNEFLLLSEGKMSKSTGTFLRLQTLRDMGVHPRVYRLFVLMAHYRSQLEISLDALASAKRSLRRLLFRMRELGRASETARIAAVLAGAAASRGAGFGYLRDVLEADLDDRARAWIVRLDEAISRDLNTAAAVAHLTELLGESDLDAASKLRVAASYDLALGIGLFELPPEDLELRPRSAGLSVEEVEALCTEREAARRARDWRRADAIRDQLTQAGVLLMDGADASWGWQLDGAIAGDDSA
jgi:cysteinyl-tRNA synthetase